MQKSNAITDLQYTGEVSVKFNINGKLVDIRNHNSGLPNLFRIIAKALAGYNTSQEKPNYIDLRYITVVNEELLQKVKGLDKNGSDLHPFHFLC